MTDKSTSFITTLVSAEKVITINQLASIRLEVNLSLSSRSGGIGKGKLNLLPVHQKTRSQPDRLQRVSVLGFLEWNAEWLNIYHLHQAEPMGKAVANSVKTIEPLYLFLQSSRGLGDDQSIAHSEEA